MMLRTWLSAVLPLVAAGMVASEGCGQGVATCSSICALPDEPGTACEASCSAKQAACTTPACSADFQAFLTCVGNAGTYVAVDGDCATLASTSGVSRVPRDGGLPLDAVAPPDGTSKPDVVATGCNAANCASVCLEEGATNDCAGECAQEMSECPAASAEFQAVFTCFCVHGTSVDAGLAFCEPAFQALAAACPVAVESPDAAAHP